MKPARVVEVKTVQVGFVCVMSYRLSAGIREQKVTYLKDLLHSECFSVAQLSRALHITLKLDILDLKKVRCLLESGASIMYKMKEYQSSTERGASKCVSEGRNCLQLAVTHHGNVECVKLLLEHCDEDELVSLIDNVDEMCMYSDALYSAIDRGHEYCAIEIYKYRQALTPHLSVTRPVCPNISDHSFHTCTTTSITKQAVTNGMAKLVCIFLDYLTKTDHTMEMRLCTSIALDMAVSSCKHKDLARELIKRGAEINCVQGGNGHTPLVQTIVNNNVHMVEWLLECQANVNHTAPFPDIITKEIPLVEAVKIKNVEMVKVLIKYGVDMSVEDEHGFTPLLLALKQDTLDIMKAIVEQDDGVQDKFSDLVIHIAACMRGRECLPYILDNLDKFRLSRHSVNECRSNCTVDGTPLSIACSHINLCHVDVLIKHGADPNLPDCYDKTPLISVIENFLCHPDCQFDFKQCCQIVIRLLQSGADVNGAKYIRSKVPSQVVTVNADVLQISDLELVPIDEVYGDHPLTIAVGLCVLPLAHLLWDAGSKPCEKVHWYKQSSHWYLKSELQMFINNITQQPRSLINIARNRFREIVGNVNVIDTMEIPANIKEYLQLSDLYKHVHRFADGPPPTVE